MALNFAVDMYEHITTSGPGPFNLAAQNATLARVVWETNGTASGIVGSILDTVSGTAASGLWLEVSGAKIISFDNPMYNSGATQDPIQVDYGLRVNSGLAIIISGNTGRKVSVTAMYLTA